MDLLFFVPIVGILAMAMTGVLFWLINRESAGTPKMKEIASYIQEGVNAFLKREFKTISYFVVVIAVVLLACFWPKWQIALGFIVGASFSLLAILIGMSAAVRANVRTMNAARTSAEKALVLAFRGGAIMGLSVVALNLLGIISLFYLFGVSPNNPGAVSLLVGFGFGASLSALFAQLGGGIYTKAADVGADLVGKIEKRIPEDDPRNPAVIADLVGDNVGDCAGRGADLFESGSDNLICTMILGLAFIPVYGWNAIIFPLLTRSIGSIGTVIGTFFVRKWRRASPITSLNIGLISTGVFSLISFYLLANWVMKDIRIFYCLSLGLFSALIVSLIVQYYTGINRRPVEQIAQAAKSGAAISLMSGFSYGLESTIFPMILIAFVMITSYLIMGGGLFGIFGIAAATLGITEMKGVIMASDAFGPIVDNAAGIGEMSALKKEVTKSTEVLDAAGNITKAITKGYAMTCCILTSIVILFTYLFEAARHLDITLTGIDSIVINLIDPFNIVAILIGAAVPFLFSALAIRAVSKTAFKMIEEVRRQFREIPGLIKGKAKPDYLRCIDISTKNALREMIAPTLIGVIAPIIVGFTLGIWALAVFLIAVKVVGALFATFMFNAGGAWDNAKKYIEAGNFGGKGTKAHAASVIGDTFGDPLKDTAGPSLHILIKLENIISITLLPLFMTYAIR